MAIYVYEFRTVGEACSSMLPSEWNDEQIYLNNWFHLRNTFNSLLIYSDRIGEKAELRNELYSLNQWNTTFISLIRLTYLSVNFMPKRNKSISFKTKHLYQYKSYSPSADEEDNQRNQDNELDFCTLNRSEQNYF